MELGSYRPLGTYIDRLISTVRRDSRSILLRFLHYVARPQDRYLENKVLQPISLQWIASLNSMGSDRKLYTWGEYTCRTKCVRDRLRSFKSRYDPERTMSFRLKLINSFLLNNDYVISRQELCSFCSFCCCCRRSVEQAEIWLSLNVWAKRTAFLFTEIHDYLTFISWYHKIYGLHESWFRHLCSHQVKSSWLWWFLWLFL